MTQSPEYPDLPWVPPKSWTDANRGYVQVIVIHDTEGSSHGQSAEDGAAYDARRTDGTSTHYFVDSNSIVQCVRTADKAHTARTQGNQRGIHYELCARASFTKADWLDPDYGLPMLKRAAKQVARDCRKWNIPAKKLTPSAVAGGAKGICGHGDITKAFPQDNGTHTDPGPNFPWVDFINMVDDILNPPEDIVEQADIDKIVNAVTARLKASLDAVPTAGEVAEAILNAKYQPGAEVYPNRTVRNFLGDVHPVRDYLSALGTVAPGQAPREGSFLNTVGGVPSTLDGIKQRIGGLEATLAEIKGILATIPPAA